MKDNEQIYGGAFQVARQIFDSEIWTKKPSTWKIIFIYILGNVNHKNSGNLKRGEGFFNFSREIKQIGCDITYDMIRHTITYLKKSGILSTKRSTRGVVVKVLNYNKFQTLDNYSGTTSSTMKAQAEHNESTPINKNDKNVKNEKKRTTGVKFKIPTTEELKQYSKEIRFPNNELRKYYNHYESNGWMVGKNKMKDWKAAMRGWKARMTVPNVNEAPVRNLDRLNYGNENITSIGDVLNKITLDNDK